MNLSDSLIDSVIIMPLLYYYIIIFIWKIIAMSVIFNNVRIIFRKPFYIYSNNCMNFFTKKKKMHLIDNN